MDRREQLVERGIDLLIDSVRDPDKYPDDFIALPLDAEFLSTILSRERARLLKAVRDAGRFESLEELARRLRRDPTRVGRDLKLLESHGFVIVERKGKAKRVVARRVPIILT